MTLADVTLSGIPGIGGVELTTQSPAAPEQAPTEATTPTPEKKPLTAREALQKRIDDAKARITRDTAFVQENEAKLDIIDKLDAVTTGWVVDIKVGRAETTRTVRGVVTGVSGEGNAKRYKVYYGEGFDAETVVIQQSQILAAEQAA